MYYVSEFCRVCLQYDLPLTDIVKNKDEPETLLNKLKLCVSEVEWSANSLLLMCQKCIDKLNSAFEFKQQCLRSTGTFENYLAQLLGSDSPRRRKSKILTETKTEEVSVEIDPSYFECMSEGPVETTEEAPDNNEKDWEDLISSSKISPGTLNNHHSTLSTLAPSTAKPPFSREANNSQVYENSFGNVNSVVPDKTYNLANMLKIYPNRTKISGNFISPELEESMELFNAGHFMTPKENLEQFNTESHAMFYFCEQCGKNYDTLKSLRYHIKQFHLGKFPYKCKYCLSEYAARSQYEVHMQKHKVESADAFSKDTITLDDLSKENAEALLFPNVNKTPNTNKVQTVNKVQNVTKPSNNSEAENDEEIGPQYEHQCNVCPRSFTSAHGLSRHKVRKHNQQTRKKYFIKGMKNAKCDICKREFSTQSYLQLHIKLHYRKSDYRRKVFNKDDYGKEKEAADNEKEAAENGEFVNETQADMDITQSDIKSHEMETDPLLENDVDHGMDENKSESDDDDDDDDDLEDLNELNEEQHKSEVTEVASDQDNGKTASTDCPNSPGFNADVQMSEPSRGIKIKINLRNIKQSSKECDNGRSDVQPSATTIELATENNAVSEVIEDVCVEPPVESFLNGSQDSSHSLNDDGTCSPTINENPFTNLSCENNRSESPSAELSEGTRSGEDYIESMDADGISDVQGAYSTSKVEMVDGKPKCSFCNKLFSRKHDLKRHMNNIHLKSIEYQCHMCNSKFYEAFHLTRHLRQHNSFLCCITCTKNFNILRDLKHHILTVHEGVAASQCGACGQVFQKIKYLKEHMQEHDKTIRYKCHICGENFIESRELTRHLVGHSGMYSCNVCQTRFSTEHELNVHFKVHYLEGKKYECEICHNKYKKKRYLVSHINHCHKAEKQNVEVLIDRVQSDYSDDDSSSCNVTVDYTV